jgi:hypothetical protein
MIISFIPEFNHKKLITCLRKNMRIVNLAYHINDLQDLVFGTSVLIKAHKNRMNLIRLLYRFILINAPKGRPDNEVTCTP